MNPMGPGRVGHSAPAQWEVKEKHFESVYNRYFQKVYGVCRRYSTEHDDARDLTHDVFMQYFLNFEKFRHEASPSTWMYRVAINLGIQRWRKNRTRSQHEMELETLSPSSQDNETMMLDRITLMKILGRYPERTRKIFSLFHVDRMTQVEISKMLGISRATVIRHLIPLKRFR